MGEGGRNSRGNHDRGPERVTNVGIVSPSARRRETIALITSGCLLCRKINIIYERVLDTAGPNEFCCKSFHPRYHIQRTETPGN